MYYDFDMAFEHLKELAQSPELKKDIEECIAKHNFSLKEVTEEFDRAWENLEAIHNKVRKELMQIAKDHNTSYDTIVTYLSLEKNFIPKFSQWYGSDFDEGFYFKNNGGDFILKGATCKKAFDCMFQPAIDFLLENIDALPESTKKYVLKRSNEAADRAKVKLSVVNNDFEAKLLSNSFTDIPDVVFLKKYFEFLKNEFSSFLLNGCVSFVFFAKAINMKYPNHNNEALKKLQKSLNITIHKEFKSLFDDWRYGDRSSEALFKSFDQILINEKLADFFFTRLSENDKTSLMALLFSKYAKNDLQKEARDKILLNALKKELNTNTIKFEEYPEDMQTFLFNEFSNRDYDINFQKLNDNLKYYKAPN